MPVTALARVTAVRQQKCDHCEREVGKYGFVSPSSTSHARVRNLVKGARMRRIPHASRHVTVTANISLLPTIPTQAFEVCPAARPSRGGQQPRHTFRRTPNENSAEI